MEKYTINDLYVGQFYEEKFLVTEEMGMQFAKISQDYNPIHLDDEAALKSRFGRKIVHGMLIGSYFSGIIGNKFPGAGSVYISQDIFFKRPIYYNTEITIKVEVIDINQEKEHVSLRTQCCDLDNNIVVDGNAKILFE